MMSIIDRYIVREVSIALSAVIVLVMVVTSGNLFARMISRASEGQLPSDILLPIVALGALKSLIYLLPVALFMAIILSFGRLYKDSEMAAMRAGGIGYGQIYRALAWLVVPYTAFSAAMILAVNPLLSEASEVVRAAAENRSELIGLEAGRFLELKQGKQVLFIESLSDNGQRMNNVFIYAEKDGTAQIVTARTAHQEVEAQTGRRFLVLEDGTRYEGSIGDAEFRIAEFGRHGVLVPGGEQTSPDQRRDMIPVSALMVSDDPKEIAELHWRLAIPLAVVVLALVAVPLSYAAPRQGRFAKLTAAILVYIIYANFITMGKSWLEKEVVPAWMGLWWVHLGMILLCVVLVARQYGLVWVMTGLGGRRAPT